MINILFFLKLFIFLLKRENIGKPIAFLWADALRDFVDKYSDQDESK